MAYNTKLRLIDAKMEQPSGSTLTLSGNTIFEVGSDGIPKYSIHPDFTGVTSVYNDPQVLVDKEYVDDKVIGQFQEMVFEDDIVVSIEAGKTFGRYEDGDIIPATGLTPREVILLAVQEPIEPTVVLSSTGNDVRFSNPDKEVNLNFSHTINSLGATVQFALVEFRRNNTGTWSTLSTSTTTPNTFQHLIDESGNRFNTQVINYRYTVVDTAGATGVTTHNVSPQTFAAGTMVINGGDTGIQGYETNTNRERGNTVSNISGSNDATSQPFNLVTQYVIERRINTGSYTVIQTVTGLNTNNVTVTSFQDTGIANTANSADYRIVFTYQNGSTSTSSLFSVTFRFATFFSPNSTLTAISNSSQLLGLGNVALQLTAANRTFTNVNPGDNEYVFYSYPSSFPALSNVELNGSSPVLGSFTQQQTAFSYTNPYSVVVNYRVYRSNSDNAFNGDTLAFQF